MGSEYKSEVAPIKDTLYLNLAGELWGVLYEGFGENGLRFNSTALCQAALAKLQIQYLAAKCNQCHCHAGALRML